eukprot:jgi/Astpho2/9398/Aster-01663
MFRGEDARRNEPASAPAYQAPPAAGSPDMLAIPFKSSSYLDLKTPISSYLYSHFGYNADRDASASKNLDQLQQMRSAAVALQGRPEDLKSTMIRYSQALAALQQHLPFSERDSEGVRTAFPWRDAFQGDKGFVSPAIQYERAAVVFNLGALSSQQPLNNDLNTDGGVKLAAKQFQEAAGYFKYLLEVLGGQLGGSPSLDVTPDCTEMLLLLCLAQAQECFFLKAQADRKNSALLARIAKQVSEFYREIEQLNSIGMLRKYLGKVWSAHITVKQLQFAAVALQREAEARMANDKCGEAIACLREGERLVEEAHQKAKGGWGGSSVGPELRKSVDFTRANVQQALDKANEQNTQLYFDTVPRGVPDIAAASLVQPVRPEGLDASSEVQQWFSFVDRLQPSTSAFEQGRGTPLPSDSDWGGPSTPERTDRGRSSGGNGRSVAAGIGKFALGAAGKVASRALSELAKPPRTDSPAPRSSTSSSVPEQPTWDQGPTFKGSLHAKDYEKMVDNQIREALQQMEAADKQQQEVLRRWQLPDSLQYIKSRDAVKPRVMQEQEKLKGSAQYLGQLFREMQGRRHTIQQELERCEQELGQQGRSRDSQVEGYRRDSDNVILAFRDNLQQAMRADAEVDRKIEINTQNFEALDFNAAASKSGMRPGDAFGSTIRGALQALDQLSAERRDLEKAYRWEWDNDDVIKGRAQGPAYDPDQPFREGLQRYSEVQKAVESNLRKQAQVLRGIDANMRSFGDLLQQSSQATEAAARQFDSLLREYNDVRNSLAEGQNFYAELQEEVQKLHQQRRALSPFGNRTKEEGEVKSKPTKAKLGEKSSFYYDEAKKCWVDGSAKEQAATEPPKGPPRSSAASLAASSGPNSNEATGPSTAVDSGPGSAGTADGRPAPKARSIANRYAAAPGFASTQATPSVSPAVTPLVGRSPLSTPEPGKVKMFNPSQPPMAAAGAEEGKGQVKPPAKRLNPYAAAGSSRSKSTNPYAKPPTKRRILDEGTGSSPEAWAAAGIAAVGTLQAAPALELTSEEKELAELNAVTDDRMMVESIAADSDSAQFLLPLGQDSAAGPTSAEAGNTVMQAAESAAASSNNALTPGEEAFSSQQAAVNPAFGGSMPWGGPSTATYAFDYDSSQALEGMGSTGPDVDFDLDGQDSQALGFSQPTGAAGSAAAAATSDRLQSDAQSQLQQGPETGPEVWGHQQQEQESRSGKERVEGHGASAAEQRADEADPVAQSHAEDPEAAAAAYDPGAMFATANDPSQVFNWTQMLDWAEYMLQQGQSPAEVHTMLGEYGVVLTQYERLIPHHIYNQAPPSELPAPYQQAAVWDELAAAEAAAMSVEGAAAEFGLQQQRQADDFQLGAEQMPLEDGLNLQQQGQGASAEAGLLGSQHQQGAGLADEFGLQQQGHDTLPSMADDFDLSAGQAGAADEFGLHSVPDALPSMAYEFSLGGSQSGGAAEFGLQSPQAGGADEFGLGGSTPQAVDEFGLHGGEPDVAADFDLRSSPLPAVADGLGLEAGSQADWDQQGTAAEDVPHKQLGSASSNIPQQRQAAARSDVQAEAEPAGSHAVLSPEGTSAEQAGASTQGPQSPGNKGDPAAGRLAAFGSSSSSPLHNPRSPRSPRQTSPQRPVTIPEDAAVAYAATQRGSPTANLEPTPSPEPEFAGALKRLTAARRDGSFADWIRPSASSEQQQQRQDAIRSMTPRERRQLREQVKMKGPWPWAEALSEDDDETWLSSGASTPESVEYAPHANGALPNGAAAMESAQHEGNEDAGGDAAQNGGLAVTGVLRGALGGLGLPEGLRGLQEQSRNVLSNMRQALAPNSPNARGLMSHKEILELCKKHYEMWDKFAEDNPDIDGDEVENSFVREPSPFVQQYIDQWERHGRGEFSEDEEQAELAEQMNAQASSQPASHTVYTVHPNTDESALGNSNREGLAEADLPADPEGWEDGSGPADSGGEAAAESEQLADPEGWDDDFPLDNMDVAQESGSQHGEAAAAAQQHLPGSGSDDEDAAWEPMHSTAVAVDSQSALGQADSVNSELMQASSQVLQTHQAEEEPSAEAAEGWDEFDVGATDMEGSVSQGNQPGSPGARLAAEPALEAAAVEDVQEQAAAAVREGQDALAAEADQADAAQAEARQLQAADAVHEGRDALSTEADQADAAQAKTWQQQAAAFVHEGQQALEAEADQADAARAEAWQQQAADAVHEGHGALDNGADQADAAQAEAWQQQAADAVAGGQEALHAVVTQLQAFQQQHEEAASPSGQQQARHADLEARSASSQDASLKRAAAAHSAAAAGELADKASQTSQAELAAGAFSSEQSVEQLQAEKQALQEQLAAAHSAASQDSSRAQQAQRAAEEATARAAAAEAQLGELQNAAAERQAELEAAAAAEERAHAAELRAVELTAQAVERVQQDADGQISDLREMLQGERDEKAELQGQLETAASKAEAEKQEQAAEMEDLQTRLEAAEQERQQQERAHAARVRELQGRQLHLRSCHFEVCLLQEQVDSLQSDLEALRQKDRDRVAHFKDKARKQVLAARQREETLQQQVDSTKAELESLLQSERVAVQQGRRLQADLADIQQQRTKLQGAQQELQVQVSRLQEEAEDLRAAAKAATEAPAGDGWRHGDDPLADLAPAEAAPAGSLEMDQADREELLDLRAKLGKAEHLIAQRDQEAEEMQAQVQGLQGQQALLQEQLSAAEASVQEAMEARQLQTERIKASKAAQKAGPNLAKATAEREEAILRADRAEHSCRQLQQQVARLHQQAASAAAHASSSAEVPASSAEESSADRAAADSNDSTEGASSAAEPAPAESGTSREGANAAELQATREQLQMAQAEVAKLKTAAAEQEEQRGQAATAVEGELSTLREVHVRLQEQYREAQGSLQAAEGAQEHLAAQSEALQEQLHQAKNVADAASSQAELQASQLQQQLDALLSEQQAGQEELQQAQGQAAEAQSRCTELETQLASIQAQAGAYQEAAGRATEEQQAAQEARASLESQLQQLEAQLKAFQDLPAQMAHAEAAHAQATAELKARLAEVEAQDATLQQQLQEAQDRVTALETQLAEAQAAVASGGIPHSPGSGADEAALTQLQQQVAELQSANAELKEEADSSWAELNAKEEELDATTARLLQSEDRAARAQAQETQEELGALRSEVATFRDQGTTARQAVEDAEAAQQELQQQLTSVQAELAALSQGGDDVTMVEGEGNAGTAAAKAAAAPAASEGTKGVVAGLTPLCLMLQERALPLAPADAPGEQFEVAQLLQALADAQGEQARLQLLLREAEEARQALEEGQEQLRDFEDLLACVGAQETKVTYLTSLLVEQHGQNEEELNMMLEQIEEDALGGETQTRDAERDR